MLVVFILKNGFSSIALHYFSCRYRNGTYLQASIAMVGFSDGFIRGYSKSGQTVFSQQLHLDAVTKLSFLYPSSLRENANQVF